MRAIPGRRCQRGAVIITVALFTLFLLGFMGLALDFGRLFIVKTELQTAMDSCALAAAQELDGASDALTRATNAGKTAGNLNKVHFQGAAAGLIDEDITFSDTLTGIYSHTFPFASAKYAKCTRTKSGVTPLLLQAMTGFSGNTAYAADQSVLAFGVATRVSAQSACPMPVAMKPKAGGVAPDYGFTIGEWVPMITNQSEFTGGHIGWMSLVDGANGTNEIRKQLNGLCGIKIDAQLEPSDNGSKTALVEPWNYRFGLYDKKPDFTDPENADKRPDLTGYAYSLENSAGSNVYDDFASRRSAAAACGATVDACLSVGAPDWKLPGSIKYIVPSGNGPDGHGTMGTNRRLVLVPVVDETNKVDGFACMLILQPLSIPMVEVQFEYRGNASVLSSPCSSSGLAGGSAGPLVPTLVR